MPRASGSIRRSPAIAFGSSKIGAASGAGGVDADDVIRPAAHQEDPLEALRVQARRSAEGGNRRADAPALGEVDEQIGRPAVDLIVGLGLHHLAVASRRLARLSSARF